MAARYSRPRAKAEWMADRRADARGLDNQAPCSQDNPIAGAESASSPLPSVSRFVILKSMTKAISVRLDDEAQRALRALEATGLSQSEAIRSALLASAQRLRKRSELAAEAAGLEADDVDRAEMLAIAAMMESVRAAR